MLPLLVAAQDLMIASYSLGSRPVRVLPSGRFLFATADRQGHGRPRPGGEALGR